MAAKTSPASPADVAILIPVFNDWAAVRMLLGDLDRALTAAGRSASVVLVDDGSTQPVPADLIGRPTALHRVSILTLRRNLGHQRALAVGLAYVEAHLPCRALVVMDGDGEDAPADVARLLDRFEAEGEQTIVFAERTRRSESTLFRIFYAAYRAAHWGLTGIRVRVGNFSVVPFSRLSSLVVVSDLWNHYPASVFRSRLPFTTHRTARARRLVGQSKMNFLSLVIHGLDAIAVFRDRVGVRLLVALAVALDDAHRARRWVGSSPHRPMVRAGRPGRRRQSVGRPAHANSDADIGVYVHRPGRTGKCRIPAGARLCVFRGDFLEVVAADEPLKLAG